MVGGLVGLGGDAAPGPRAVVQVACRSWWQRSNAVASSVAYPTGFELYAAFDRNAMASWNARWPRSSVRRGRSSSALSPHLFLTSAAGRPMIGGCPDVFR